MCVTCCNLRVFFSYILFSKHFLYIEPCVVPHNCFSNSFYPNPRQHCAKPAQPLKTQNHLQSKMRIKKGKTKSRRSVQHTTCGGGWTHHMAYTEGKKSDPCRRPLRVNRWLVAPPLDLCRLFWKCMYLCVSFNSPGL